MLVIFISLPYKENVGKIEIKTLRNQEICIIVKQGMVIGNHDLISLS
jgi:hypothetical protein